MESDREYAGSQEQFDPYPRDNTPTYSYEIQYGRYDGEYIPQRMPTFYRIPGPSGNKYTFTDREIRELLLSIGVLTFAFAKVLGGWDDLLVYLIPSFIAVFTGFFLHEMGHKFFAQKYGLFSEFRMSMQGLALALFTSMIGFLIAAPGAVMISGYPTREQTGKTAFAGPGTNVLIAFVFLPLRFVGGGIAFTADLVIFINAFLALFNLIPVSPLDGQKIWSWNPVNYLLLVGLSLFFFITSIMA